MSNSAKRVSLIAAVSLVSALTMGALVGCMPAGEQAPDAAATHRAYMSSVNTISAEAAGELADFSAAAASGDIAAMRVASNTAAATLGQIESLTVPEDMAAVHAEYLAGAQEMSQALTDYVAVYAKYVNETFEDDAARLAAQSAMESELAPIQELYDSGVAHFSAADSMVVELGGVEHPEAEQGAEAEQSEQEGAARA